MAERFDELKGKYGSVLREIEQQQVRLQNVNMEGDKLFIRGEAPSDEAKNKVWDQIKLVDPSYGDLICDITVSAVSAERTMTAGAGAAAPAEAEAKAETTPEVRETYTVQPGDTLSKIAEQCYGSAREYMRIFEANRDQLDDPNLISPGQQLVIPKEEE